MGESPASIRAVTLRPQGHVIASAGLGAIFWAKSRDPWTMVVSLGFGVLVDLDHLIDYWYSERRLTFDVHEFMGTRYWRRSGRIFVLFHAFEYLPLVYFFWQGLKGRKWAVAATTAMSVHVVADHFINDLKPLGYFIVYRMAHGFRAEEIIDCDRAERLDAIRKERRRLGVQGKASLGGRLVSLFV